MGIILGVAVGWVMAKHVSGAEEEAMAPLWRDIYKQQRAQSACIGANVCPQDGPAAWEVPCSES